MVSQNNSDQNLIKHENQNRISSETLEPVKKKITASRRILSIIVVFSIFFVILIATTIFFNLLMTPFNKAVDDGKDIEKAITNNAIIQNNTNAQSLQTGNFSTNEFILHNFKIKYNPQKDWKAYLTISDPTRADDRKITLFDSLGDKIEITLKYGLNSKISDQGNGSIENYNVKDLKDTGKVLEKEIYRMKDIDKVIAGQQYSENYIFSLISLNDSNKLSTTFSLRDYQISINYITPVNKFPPYGQEELLQTFDKVLQALTIVS